MSVANFEEISSKFCILYYDKNHENSQNCDINSILNVPTESESEYIIQIKIATKTEKNYIVSQFGN